MPRNYSGSVTVEGEQVILALQVGRFLIKAVRAVRAGQPVAATAQYLKDPPITRIGDEHFAAGATPALLDLLRDRASRHAAELCDEFTALERGGATFDEALNAVAGLSYKASECHSAYVMAKNNAASLAKFVTDPGIRAAMQRLFELMVLQQVQESAGDWADAVSSATLRLCRRRVNALLLELRQTPSRSSTGSATRTTSCGQPSAGTTAWCTRTSTPRR